MIFSKACEYGIKAAIYVAEQSINGNRASLKGISKEIDSPEAFTAKVLQTLVKNNIINSVKGSTGGFEADLKKIKKIKLIEIVIAIDGSLHEGKCVLGLSKCSEISPCPVHNKYKHIKKDILEMLEKTTLAGMSNSVIEGLSCLKN
jgi:Rrf2 family protein